MIGLDKFRLLIFSLCVIANCPLQAQFEFPELILDNDGLEMDDSFEVSFTDEIVDPGTYSIQKLVSNSNPPELWSDHRHDFYLFDTPLSDFYANEGYVIEFTNNTAIVMVSLQNYYNSSDKLTTYYSLMGGGTWDEIVEDSELPVGYRNDFGFDVDYESWRYYFINGPESYVYGADRLEGTLLNVVHAPINSYYRYQIGTGTCYSEFQTGENGWVTASGELVINGDGEEPQVINLEAIPAGFEHVSTIYYGQVVLRTYTISDSEGNVYTEEIYKVLPSSCPGDYNQDGFITSSDLSLLLADFGCFVNCPTDLTNDGAVFVNDISFFLGQFGFNCQD